jgi:hypothetical protein
MAFLQNEMNFELGKFFHFCFQAVPNFSSLDGTPQFAPFLRQTCFHDLKPAPELKAYRG